MTIAIFGLGKMGGQIARRLHKAGFDVLAWNRSEAPRKEVAKAGVKTFDDVSKLMAIVTNEPRIFWLMLPHAIVGEFLENQLYSHLKPGDIVIDGGNSFYRDSISRNLALKVIGVHFFDCGVSGGVWGEENGFALMVGGPKEIYPKIEPIFKALSTSSDASAPTQGSGKVGVNQNCGLVGESGAGHFVKMVHNGIEYGMMEAIAEGYGVLKAAPFNFDLHQITKIYQQGTVIRSWLIDLVKEIFEKENLDKVKGVIEASGEGEWTVQTAKELGVDVRVIEAALKVRQESSKKANQNKFSNKLVALLRKQFGGHEVKR